LARSSPAQTDPALSDPALAARNLEAALGLLGALADGGVSHWVVCPGSRSGPLATAVGLLVAAGRGQLHTAIDERSAAFFALGLGLATGEPAAVITTSGTAVANLLPAAVEADHGAVALLLLTADRPARLKGCGANQTVNQETFLAPSARWLGQGDGRGLASMEPDALHALATAALAHCRGGDGGGGGGQVPGPVHLNLAFEEPLHAASLPAGVRPGIAGQAAAEIAGKNRVTEHATMACEDFAAFAAQVPSVFTFLGTASETAGSTYPHHNPRFAIDEETLPSGVEFLLRSALHYFSAEAGTGT